ncbi:hypothetical protein [Candidatus Nanohalovita haloferacivicina]|uniref:hypothetical protein n=1 Tax=Candidatus Nanohalovita haloferacivicina TaxID=2978046 RepID=UPI00325FD36B|nr:putative membrane protein related to bactofilin [Candidatus Nanohalobia archaeon BNXNv]
MRIKARTIRFLLAVFLTALLIPGVAGETVFEDRVTVNSNSSMTVFAQDVTVENVNGSLTVFTQNLDIEGPVTGNVKAYAQNVNIYSTIGGDAEFYTQSFSLKDTGQVNGTLTVAAENTHLNGWINDARVESENLVVDSGAQISGTLRYRAERFEQQTNVTGQIVEAPRDIDLVNTADIASEAVMETAEFLIRIFAGLLLIAFAPRYSQKISEAFRSRTAASGFLGLMAAILLPAATFILALTIVGLPLAAITGLLFLILYLLGTFYGPYSLLKNVVGTEERGHDYAAMVLGVVLWTLLDALPLLGDIAQLVIAVIGIGAFILPGWEGMGRRIRR